MWSVVITVMMALFGHNFLTWAKYSPGLTIDINMNLGSASGNKQKESGMLNEKDELQSAIGRNLNLGSK